MGTQTSRATERRRVPWCFPVGPLVVIRANRRYQVRFERRKRTIFQVGTWTLCDVVGHQGQEIPPSLRRLPGLRFRCKRCYVEFG